MASITKRPNGHRWLTFKAPNGKRQTLRLGAASESQAHVFKTRVERLLVAHKLGEPPDPATVEWLTLISEELHCKLAKLGLCKARGARTVGELVALFQSRSKGKPSTILNENIAGARLITFFGEERKIVSVTPEDADSFREWLLKSGGVEGGPLARTTASRTTRRARQIFEKAVKPKWIPENPFAEQRGWIETNPERDLYIPAEQVESVIEQMVDPAMRLLMSLVRYGALRCPSEVLPLQWSWVDFAHNTLFVRAVKTEQYEGKGTRTVPLHPQIIDRMSTLWGCSEFRVPAIFPDLQKITGAAITNRLEVACRRAGVVLWTKPFVNLRASAEYDWLRSHPIDMVAAWTGHSPETMLRHYNRVFKEQSARNAAGALQAHIQSGSEAPKGEARKAFAGVRGERLRTDLD